MTIDALVTASTILSANRTDLLAAATRAGRCEMDPWASSEACIAAATTTTTAAATSPLHTRTAGTASAAWVFRWWVAQKISSPPELAGLMNSTDVLPTVIGCITDAVRDRCAVTAAEFTGSYCTCVQAVWI